MNDAKSKKPLKLNIGCGQETKPGYVGLDMLGIGDAYWNLNNPLEYPTNSVSEIRGIHVLEHLKRVGLEEVVESWHRCLKKGGKLILEMPDFVTCINLYLNTKDEEYLKWVFGNQEHEGQFHCWGWSPDTIGPFLEKIGFSKVKVGLPEDKTRPINLCFRVEATK